MNSDLNGGERGIRTPVTVAGKSDFESDAFDHSAISPNGKGEPYVEIVKTEAENLTASGGFT
jgi:hypothetical protein